MELNSEKQIEEMAKVLKGMDRLDEAKFGFYESYARAIYNAGYRKTSDLAEEIFAEIETSLMIESFHGGEVYYAIRAEDYLHYKKKYTESEKEE